MSEAVTHLRNLVAIDSTSSRSNIPVIDYLEQVVLRAGFASRRYPYVDSNGVKKQNLVAIGGPGAVAGGAAGLALVGHTDCVPYDPTWTSALQLTERDGALFGRGAADTKGFIAAALAAVEQAGIEALQAPLGLIFTADEEVGCAGAKRLVEERPILPRVAIIGEPTSLVPVRAHKGYCLAEIEITGREGHSAYPASGVSAILAAGRLLGMIETMAARLAEDTAPDFEPPSTTVNVGLIEGGKAKNIIAGSCKLTVEWRPIPSQVPERVERELRTALAALESEMSVRTAMLTQRLDRGLATHRDGAGLRLMERLCGYPATTVSFGTEGPQLAELGAEAVIFGPGDIRVAHQTGEYVPAAHLTRATGILAEVIRTLC